MFGFGKRAARTVCVEGRASVLFEQGMEWAEATVFAARAAPNDRAGEHTLCEGAGLLVLRLGGAGALDDEVLFERDAIELGEDQGLALPKGITAAQWHQWEQDPNVRVTTWFARAKR